MTFAVKHLAFLNTIPYLCRSNFYVYEIKILAFFDSYPFGNDN